MMEGTHRLKTLLGVEVFRVSEELIYQLRKNEYRKDKVFDFLPTYTLNKNKGAEGQMIEARDYLQFAGTMGFDNRKPDEFVFFDLSPCDTYLMEEISECSEEEFFDGFDWNKLLKPFMPEVVIRDAKNFNYYRTLSNFIIVEITYTTSQDYYSGGYDTDVEWDITHYLDGNFEKKKYENVLLKD